LANFSKYFKEQSDEEREHAEKFMKFQNQRGGRIKLSDIKALKLLWLEKIRQKNTWLVATAVAKA